MNGYAVFFKFEASLFLTACTSSDMKQGAPLMEYAPDINIPIFAALYSGYKLIYRTRVWKPLEMDFVTVSSNALQGVIFLRAFASRVFRLSKRRNYHQTLQ